MPRALNWELLSPNERRVAHLHIAEASIDTIAYLTEQAPAHVNDVLNRPHVRKYILKLVALNGDEMKPAIQNVTDAIEKAATRAFEVEEQAMERLFGLDDVTDRRFVHAQVSSAQIAQDILDRAGKRAPTKIAQTVTYGIDERSLDSLTRIIKEQDAIDVTPSIDNSTDGD